MEHRDSVAVPHVDQKTAGGPEDRAAGWCIDRRSGSPTADLGDVEGVEVTLARAPILVGAAVVSLDDLPRPTADRPGSDQPAPVPGPGSDPGPGAVVETSLTAAKPLVPLYLTGK